MRFFFRAPLAGQEKTHVRASFGFVPLNGFKTFCIAVKPMLKLAIYQSTEDEILVWNLSVVATVVGFLDPLVFT